MKRKMSLPLQDVPKSLLVAIWFLAKMFNFLAFGQNLELKSSQSIFIDFVLKAKTTTKRGVIS